MKYTDPQIRQMVFDWLARENQENDRNPTENGTYKSLAEECYYSVIENYTPCCPGFSGDILTVVFGQLEAMYIFTIQNNKLNLYCTPNHSHTPVQVQQQRDGELSVWMDLKNLFGRYGLKSPVVRGLDVNPRAKEKEHHLIVITVNESV